MARDGKIGPGAFIAVVGPSGAGKDTLLRGAQQALADTKPFHFPRRLVTRAADSALEDHDTIREADFEKGCSRGTFALCWRAHGLGYAVPASVDRQIGSGAIVMCNLSRSVLAGALEKYRHMVIAHVSAPVSVLADRLAARGRESRADIESRLRRAHYDLPVAGEIVRIDNIGSPQEGTQRLVGLATGLAAALAS